MASRSRIPASLEPALFDVVQMCASSDNLKSRIPYEDPTAIFGAREASSFPAPRERGWPHSAQVQEYKFDLDDSAAKELGIRAVRQNSPGVFLPDCGPLHFTPSIYEASHR
ncbi:hypothetical protein TgHK011_003384 [Trichoderma gracile]|nr:hypothetical protein TgHK011_003384 [Trichoderma gracile]